MLPTQILLNNFLYDLAQITIPPTISTTRSSGPRSGGTSGGIIQRFMVVIGPIRSIYDFLMFGVLLWVSRASEALFQTGWFVESLATQTLVLFVIRTAGNPLRSRPSLPLALTTVLVVLIGVILPFTPLAAALGFVPPGRLLRVSRRSHHDLSRPRRAGQTPTDAQTAQDGPRNA